MYSDSSSPTPGHPARWHETPESLVQSLVTESRTRDVTKTYTDFHVTSLPPADPEARGKQCLPETRGPHSCSVPVFSLKQHLQRTSRCFHVLAIIHSAAMNTGARVF